MRSSALQYRFVRLLFVGCSFLALILLAACSSTAPRFRTAADPDSTDEDLYAKRIRDEELREDDRRVDLQQIKNRLVPSHGRIIAEDDAPEGLSRDRVLLDVVSYLGVPYRYGGTTKQGIDCSGFTSQVYASAASVALPRSTREQYQVGLKVSRDELRFGDLVFFNTTGRRPSHVGIYIEDDLFAHASLNYGVTFSSLESSYYKKRFVGARRVMGQLGL